MPLHAGAAALLLSTAALAAHGQPIYRCADNSYTQQPCPGGQPVAEPPPPPSPADRAQAGSNTRRDAAMAGSLERDRQRQESQSAASLPLYIPPPASEPVPEPYRTPEKKATRKLDVFTAHAPAKKPDDLHKRKTHTDATKAAAPMRPATTKALAGQQPVHSVKAARPAKPGSAT